MDQRNSRALLAASVLAALATQAGAVGVAGTKLIIVDKPSAPAKVVYVSKLDDGIEKGAEGDAGLVSATFEVRYADPSAAAATFTMPEGAAWLVNKATVLKYANKAAPTDGGVKVAVVKPGKVAKVVAKSLGDTSSIDLVAAGAPSDAGGVITNLVITNGNDASTHQMCTTFATDAGSKVVYKEIAGGAGRKLVAKGGVATCEPCEVLNAAECLLPFPSSRFEVPDPSTGTGVRLAVPDVAMPSVNGDPWLAAPFNQLDGFSPLGPVLMHFPQGVDLALSDAARLLAPGCCGQPAGPPWIDTRTYTDRSLDPDSPSVLLDVDTGERVLHWLEVDGRATGDAVPGRQVVFLRPAQSLVPGHRYVVAMRGLKDAGDADVVAEAAFAALRDATPSDDPEVERRRAGMESAVFGPLADAGITRDDLVLAFDFVVQSENQLTRQMLSMRDQAFAWLDTVEADAGAVTFTVDAETTNDCGVAGTVVWKKVSGTFQSPLFLDGPPVQDGAQFLNVDDDDVPVQNGFMNAPYDVTIPCSIHDGGTANRPIVLGHGIFGTGEGMVDFVPASKTEFGDPWDYIAGATDWMGLSGNRDQDTDFFWIGEHIVGVGDSAFNNFPALPDRLRQGMLNTLVLARMMKRGLFNRDSAFDHPLGGGVFPGASEEMYYYGISLGGIMGTWFSALTPDVERFGLDVPAISFGCLLQRSTQFAAFDLVIALVGVSDPMQSAMLISLVDLLWVSAEPAGFARHITTDPLPGSGSPSKVLYHVGWLDKQVSNQCTEAAVRTLGIPNLNGSLQSQLADIPDVDGPVDSAQVTWDTGAFDLFNPAHAPYIPALSNIIPSGVCDPHNGPRQIPAAVRQLLAFLQPGGQITNTCNGVCDADGPLEIPGGGTCDGSSPVELQGLPCGVDDDCGVGACTGGTICDPLNP